MSPRLVLPLLIFPYFLYEQRLGIFLVSFALRLYPITFYHSNISGLTAESSLVYPRLLHVNKQYFACKCNLPMRPNPYPSICHRLLQHSCPAGGDNVNTLLVMILHQYLHDAFMCVSVMPLLKSRLQGDLRDSSQDGLITITTIVLQSYCAPMPPLTPTKFLFGLIIAQMSIAQAQGQMSTLWLNNFIEK